VANTPFQVEVLTPDGEVFSEEVTMVSTKTTVGSIGILAKHQPLLAMLDPTELRLYRSESEVVRYAQGEGYLQVAHDGHVLVLIEEAHDVDKLDASELEQQLRRAEEELSGCEEGTARHGSLQREKQRFETFLEIARGDGGS
jgi:F-type H+-transporting ATPase subunit epsilon